MDQHSSNSVPLPFRRSPFDYWVMRPFRWSHPVVCAQRPVITEEEPAIVHVVHQVHPEPGGERGEGGALAAVLTQPAAMVRGQIVDNIAGCSVTVLKVFATLSPGTTVSCWPQMNSAATNVPADYDGLCDTTHV
jgi:hypothetical protein